AHVRVAWTMQAPGQGLGKSQPPRPRIPTSRVDQVHAEKAMQSNMIFPDRLLGSVPAAPGHIRIGIEYEALPDKVTSNEPEIVPMAAFGVCADAALAAK